MGMDYLGKGKVGERGKKIKKGQWVGYWRGVLLSQVLIAIHFYFLTLEAEEREFVHCQYICRFIELRIVQLSYHLSLSDLAYKLFTHELYGQIP